MNITIQLCAHCAARARTVSTYLLTRHLERTYEPRDEVEAPHVVEASLVRPAGKEEEHGHDRDIGDDDVVAYAADSDQ